MVCAWESTCSTPLEFLNYSNMAPPQEPQRKAWTQHGNIHSLASCSYSGSAALPSKASPVVQAESPTLTFLVYYIYNHSILNYIIIYMYMLIWRIDYHCDIIYIHINSNIGQCSIICIIQYICMYMYINILTPYKLWHLYLYIRSCGSLAVWTEE
jgi:hypothetical protein